MGIAGYASVDQEGWDFSCVLWCLYTKKKGRYSPQDIPGTDTFTDVFRI